MTFEARSSQASLWKKLVDAMKELVTEVNMTCSPEGVAVQSMDAAHVALVSMGLNKSGFEMYHMERECVIGISMGNFGKILKTVDNGDSLELNHNLDDNVLTVVAENKDNTRNQEFQLKLMEIETEQMEIPDIDYKASITMSAAEFAKICRDMAVFGDTITVSITRENVKFSADGDIGTGSTSFKCEPKHVSGNQTVNELVNAAARNKSNGGGNAGGIKQEVKTEADGAVKQEVKQEVKPEPGMLDDDIPLATQLSQGNRGGVDAAPTGDDDGKGKKKSDIGVSAFMTEATELSFALRYFTTFSKGASLSDTVSIYLSTDAPCKIEYIIEPFGHLSFFLAPKVESNE